MGAPDMVRVIVYDRTDSYVCDIDPTKLLDLTSTEEVNGEHSLTIKTTQELAKTDRLLVRDGMGIWHEYVVVGLVGEHGGRRVGAVAHEYYCVWSVQYDLSATYIDTQVGLVPGHPSVPAPARSGLEAALSGTNRWQIGTITVTNSGSASFYRRDGWEGLKTLTEQWGGEIDVTITVGTNGVTGRFVNLLERVGTADVTRRFDYGSDLKDIKRKVSDDVWPCRIVPLGKATETEAGGYSRRPTIAAANDGIVWLEDSDAVPLTRVPDGQGGWEYPTSIIKNDVYSDPAQLKAWALDHIGQYTRPQVTYEAELVQLVKAGLNPHGVALGDDVIVVDHDFGGEGLAITARVIKIQQNLLDSTDTKLTVGNAPKTLSGTLGGMARGIERLDEQSTAAATYQATAAYLSTLLGRLNDEINLTGGYFYIVEGLGARCYDTQVTDPAVGSEASKVVEIRGGTIRIADTKTAQGEWNWRTVFVSGHIAADLVTAANITAGYIGSAGSGNYWDLDSGEFRLASTAQLGSKTVAQVVSGIDSTITGVDVQYAQGTSATVAPTTGWSSTPPAWEQGKYIWQRTATTTAAGTTYSTPVMISGKDGADGTSVTILGSYNTLAELQAAHPTGNMGDGYMVGPDLYVWNGSAWEDVGQIQGPQGPQGATGPQGPTGASGADGTSVTVTSIQYGTSASASVTPTNWTTTVPTSIADGTWLWVRTTYSTGQVTVTKSYSGTDGTDGTDGADGADGADGIGVTAIVEQYYLSTSSTAVTGGSWSNTQQAYVSGKYYWTRSRITWSDTSITTTTPVLAQGLNNANAVATTTKADLDVLNTQQGVFNKLTNNGALQGLYMQNGELYVNATYLVSGIIASRDGLSSWNLDTGVMDFVGGLTLLIRRTTNDVNYYVKMANVEYRNGLSNYTSPGLEFTADSDTYGKVKAVLTGSFKNGTAQSDYNDAALIAYGAANLIGYADTSTSATGDSSNVSAGRSLTSEAHDRYYSNRCSVEIKKSGIQVSAMANNAFLPPVSGYGSGVFLVVEVTSSAAVKLRGSFSVSGTKSRLAETETYGDRLLYCDETPSPTFTDFGSGTIGEDGLCYVEIDPIFAETARTDMAYQVFLQKCGRGDLWVSEKRPGWFVVEGTPGLAFDWQLKAHQTGYEYERLDSSGLTEQDADLGSTFGADGAYGEELEYARQIEALYETEESDEAA